MRNFDCWRLFYDSKSILAADGPLVTSQVPINAVIAEVGTSLHTFSDFPGVMPQS